MSEEPFPFDPTGSDTLEGAHPDWRGWGFQLGPYVAGERIEAGDPVRIGEDGRIYRA